MVDRPHTPDAIALCRRTLEAFVLIALILVAGCGSPLSAEQKQAMARIQSLGGKINTEGGGYNVTFSGSSIENDDLAILAKIPALRELDLRGTRITDEGLVHLRKLESMTILRLERTTVTKEGIDKLTKSLPNLVVMH
jgi:hypothetical protein